ncbi:MAG: type II toxin-antitoxin system Phd/YefM family antitoxin [Mycobacteriaceae bacterium]|uniref:type II toxin-antitoxin system Phd/YefM family antitoxin n=1 Tax=Corynebacterium sp. TaxID=1720 RepID=UPI003F9C1614
MVNTISVGQLRKNPTQMLREVRNGATYTITDHGEPVAEVTPRRHRWVAGEEVRAFFKERLEDENRPDAEAWIREIEDLRDAEPLRDPWEQ